MQGLRAVRRAPRARQPRARVATARAVRPGRRTRRSRGCPSWSRGRRGRCPAPATSTSCSDAIRATTGRQSSCRRRWPSARTVQEQARACRRRLGLLRGRRFRARRSLALGGCLSGRGLGRSLLGRGRCAVAGLGRSRAGLADDGEASTDVDGFALLDEDLLDTAPVPGLGTSVSTLSVESSSGSSAWIFLALLLEPLGDRPLGDGHAHLGHHDVDGGWGGHGS